MSELFLSLLVGESRELLCAKVKLLGIGPQRIRKGKVLVPLSMRKVSNRDSFRPSTVPVPENSGVTEKEQRSKIVLLPEVREIKEEGQ